MAQEQSNISTNIKVARIGMNLEANLNQLPQGVLSYALNAIVEGFDGKNLAYQNEPGNTECITFPDGYKCIGRHVIYELNRVVYFLANPDTRNSEIGYSDIDDCTYFTKINAACLNFDINYPILQVVHKITETGLELYWVDGYNKDRWLQWENLPYKTVYDSNNCPTVDTSIIDCNKLNINPNFSIPKIDIVSEQDGGNIESGTVQFCVQYANSNGEPYTSVYSVTNPYPVFYKNLLTLNFNTPVSKSVKLSISDIDISGAYKYINLIVIKTVNDIVSVELVDTIQVQSSTVEFIYTGQNKTQIRMNISDIYQKYPIYETSKIITSSNDVLIRANLKQAKRISYQNIANKINLFWRAEKTSDTYANPIIASTKKGYMRDEVYAFDIVFLEKNGRQSDRFPIPGREATPYDLEIINNADTGFIPTPRWKVYNTATSDGKFGYYESEFKYPCDELMWGDLSNKPIRHHRFPDSTISHIHDNNGNIYPIGVAINTQQVIDLLNSSSLSQEEKDNVQGFKIIRANRVNNKSIIAKGMIRNVGQYTKDETTYYFPNYPYNSLQDDPFLEGTSYTEDSKQRFTFQSPDTTFYQPYLGSKLKLETIEYGESEGHFQQVKNHSRYKIYTDGLYLTALGVAGGLAALQRWFVVGLTDGGTIFDFNSAAGMYQTLIDIFERVCPYINYVYQYNSIGNYINYIPITREGYKIRSLDIAQYIINGYASVGDKYQINNYNRESSVYLKLKNSIPYAEEYSGIPQDNSRYTLRSEGLCDNYTKIVKKNINGYYCSIKSENVGQYNSIYSYDTVDTGFQFMLSDSPGIYTIYGGDVFINKFAYKTKMPFFTVDRVGAPDGSDIFYNEIGNVGNPRYWYSAESKSNSSGFFQILTGVLFGTKMHQLDCPGSQFFYRTGKMYLQAYGIPYFFCESEVNVDYRQAFTDKEGDFYPRMSTGIPDEWLQPINVPIIQDNTYYYNKTFSKQNKENSFTFIPLGYKESDTFSHRCIFSEDRTEDPQTLQRNNWLIYKPSSYFDFPQSFGKLTSLDGMDNKQVLVRFENKALIYNSLLTMPTSIAQAYVGLPMFSKEVPPVDLGNTDMGYVGSRHKFLLKTEFGLITVDDKRGQVFLVTGQGAIDLTNSDSGVNQFFNKNLEVVLKKYFPSINVDNHYNGVGVHGVYDAKYNRLILTKIDYEPLKNNIKLDDNGFYIEKGKKIISSGKKCCPSGYNLIEDKCVRQTLSEANKISNSDPFVATRVRSDVYSKFGARIYNNGFNSNGTAVQTGDFISLTNSLWLATNNTTGRMNQCAIWNSQGNAPFKQWVTTSFQINSTSKKTYYIGCAGDNSIRIKIGCNDVVNFNLSGGYNANGIGTTEAFNYWHIYSIEIEQGLQTIELSGWNDDSIAGFGFEIYDNSLSELTSATNPSDLNIIFSTASLEGISNDSFNYQCDSCNSLVKKDDNYYCLSTDSFIAPNCDPIEVVDKQYVSLSDTNYFCNKSFTISYDFDNKSWISFHSYIPKFYVGSSNFFLSATDKGTWKHLDTYTLYNNFYGEIAPYVIEYPCAYNYQDEILQNVKDYSKVFRYDDFGNPVELNREYFNKLILSNGQQTSGILQLDPKPLNNMNAYMKYPIYNEDSKTILFTKSDNFYQINTFWSLVKDRTKPIFLKSCESLSVDKVLNQSNMDYGKRSYKKEPLRAKDLKARYILDNKSDIRIISQLINLPSQISYK